MRQSAALLLLQKMERAYVRLVAKGERVLGEAKATFVMEDQFKYGVAGSVDMRFFDNVYSLDSPGTEMTYRIKSGVDSHVAIDHLFEKETPLVVTCQLVRSLAIYKGLLDVLRECKGIDEGNAIFNELYNDQLLLRDYDILCGMASLNGFSSMLQHLEKVPIHPLAYFIDVVSLLSSVDLQRGDFVYFNNDSGYIEKHPFGNARRTAAMMLRKKTASKEDVFVSFPGGLQLENDILKQLVQEFNSVSAFSRSSSKLQSTDIPGLDLIAVLRFNFEKLYRLLESPDLVVAESRRYIEVLSEESRVAFPAFFKKSHMPHSGLDALEKQEAHMRKVNRAAKKTNSAAVALTKKSSYDQAHVEYVCSIAMFTLCHSFRSGVDMSFLLKNLLHLATAHKNCAVNAEKGQMPVVAKLHAREALFSSRQFVGLGGDKNESLHVVSRCNKLLIGLNRPRIILLAGDILSPEFYLQAKEMLGRHPGFGLALTQPAGTPNNLLQETKKDVESFTKKHDRESLARTLEIISLVEFVQSSRVPYVGLYNEQQIKSFMDLTEAKSNAERDAIMEIQGEVALARSHIVQLQNLTYSTVFSADSNLALNMLSLFSSYPDLASRLDFVFCNQETHAEAMGIAKGKVSSSLRVHTLDDFLSQSSAKKLNMKQESPSPHGMSVKTSS